MTASTRDQFIAAAKVLFAQRGFYGASIAAIATELGLTKQALLHHFGSKEKLYGEVLKALSGDLLAATAAITDAHPDPATRLEELVVLQLRSQMADPCAARLIMRELLDNERRAENAGNWYLQPYLDTLIDAALAIEPLRADSRGRALAIIYQLLGAAHYFTVSTPTLTSIFGAGQFGQARDSYEEELRLLVRARIAA